MRCLCCPLRVALVFGCRTAGLKIKPLRVATAIIPAQILNMRAFTGKECVFSPISFTQVSKAEISHATEFSFTYAYRLYRILRAEFQLWQIREGLAGRGCLFFSSGEL